jgi:hypothetical protein
MKYFLAPKYFIFFVAAFFLLLPIFVFGPGGADLLTASLMAKNFSQEFWHGNFYPRWLPEMYAGQGSPAFFYYPPLFFWVVSLIAPVFSEPSFFLWPLIGAAYFFLILSGVFCFHWLKSEGASDSAAKTAALIYMAFPTHLSQTLFAAALFGQFAAYAFFPLILWSAKSLAKQQKFSLLAFSLSMHLLLLCNVPNALIINSLACVWLLINSEKNQKISALKNIFNASFLAILASAFFLLPAFAYQQYSGVAAHWESGGIPVYKSHLLRFDFSAEKIIANISYASDLLILTLLCSWLLFWNKKIARKIFYFWCLASFLAIFMNLGVSEIIWRIFPLLKIIQIPSRLLCVVVLACVWLWAQKTQENNQENPQQKSAYALAIFIILVSVAHGFIVAKIQKFDPLEAAQKLPLLQLRYQNNIDNYTHYLPGKNAAFAIFGDEKILQQTLKRPKIELLEGKLQIDVEKWRARDLLVRIRGDGAGKIIVRQFYFPGWIACLSAEMPEEKSPSKNIFAECFAIEKDISDLLLVNIPAAIEQERFLKLQLSPLWPEVIGRLISVFCYLGCLTFLLIMRMKKNR